MSAKYTYKFVRTNIGGNGFTGNFSTEYQQIIDEHARDGWRFVQAFSPSVGIYGSASKVDLIFEKEED